MPQYIEINAHQSREIKETSGKNKEMERKGRELRVHANVLHNREACSLRIGILRVIRSLLCVLLRTVILKSLRARLTNLNGSIAVTSHI